MELLLKFLIKMFYVRVSYLKRYLGYAQIASFQKDFGLDKPLLAQLFKNGCAKHPAESLPQGISRSRAWWIRSTSPAERVPAALFGV